MPPTALARRWIWCTGTAAAPRTDGRGGTPRHRAPRGVAFGRQLLGRGTVGRRQRHADVDGSVWCNAEPVDEPELVDIDRALGVVALPQRLDPFALDYRLVSHIRLLRLPTVTPSTPPWRSRSARHAACARAGWRT